MGFVEKQLADMLGVKIEDLKDEVDKIFHAVDYVLGPNQNGLADHMDAIGDYVIHCLGEKQ